MTTWHVLLGIVFAIGLYFGWKLAHRPPWHGRLGTWKLDPAVRRSKRKWGYKPTPDHAPEGWQRPTNRSYCLRCGKYPYTGPEIMVDRHNGLHCLCYLCFQKCNTTLDELKRYAHQVIDFRICQNFDPRFIHPDYAESIPEFIDLWDKIESALEKMEESRA